MKTEKNRCWSGQMGATTPVDDPVCDGATALRDRSQPHRVSAGIWVAVLLCFGVVASCTDKQVAGRSGDGATENDSSQPGPGDDGQGGGDAGPNRRELCQATPPASGSVCAPPAASGPGMGSSARAHCSWGDDPRPQCRTLALCEKEGTWSVTEPAPDCTKSPPLPAACGDSAPTPGTSCEGKPAECWFPDGMHCWCSECAGGSSYPVCQLADPPEWACNTPIKGCPATLPQAGTACSEEGQNCGESCDLAIRCTGGFWVWQQDPCPICVAPHTAIATPSGERSIEDLRPGDLVYSKHEGRVVPVPLLLVGSTPVVHHRVMRVTLQSGVVLEVSPGHPTADGRTFADLRVDHELDGMPIVGSELVPYEYARTYDILPDSDSGTYFAGGALIGSTLR